jgi:DNA-3-methyladenine glycosylase
MTGSMRSSKPDLSSSLEAAKSLLGWKLVHETDEGVASGYIVETEAYDMEDPASHSFGGMRGRNVPMYQEAGTIYVYFTYGMHYCVNIVTGPKDYGQAVLIRALQPLDGISLMKERRGISDENNLTNGPAKLVQALGISKHANGTKLGGRIRLEPGFLPEKIVQTTRIGITKAVDQQWRFYVAGNHFVSKP